MRRSSLFLLLLSWLPAIFAGTGGALARGVPARELDPAAGSIAAHDAGPRRPQPAELLAGNAVPPSSVRVDTGPAPVPPPLARTGRAPQAGSSPAGHIAAQLRRLDSALDHTRARTGFLTTVFTTAPPRTHA